MFEFTKFEFKLLLVYSLVFPLPVVPCKEDKPNLDGIFKLVVISCYCRSLNLPKYSMKQKILREKSFKRHKFAQDS